MKISENNFYAIFLSLDNIIPEYIWICLDGGGRHYDNLHGMKPPWNHLGLLSSAVNLHAARRREKFSKMKLPILCIISWRLQKNKNLCY